MGKPDTFASLLTVDSATMIGPTHYSVPFKGRTLDVALWDDPTMLALFLAILAADDTGRAEAVLKAFGVTKIIDSENRTIWPVDHG